MLAEILSDRYIKDLGHGVILLLLSYRLEKYNTSKSKHGRLS
jgi:hypothetical protein